MAYCTVDDLVRILSSAGAIAFSDHNEDGVADPGVYNDCIDQAYQEINFALHERYDPDQLENSSLINRWAAVISCYFLCHRRGNPVPESIQSEVSRILFDEDSALSEIRRGNRTLPGLEPNRGQAPSFANMGIDRRFRRPQKVQWDISRYNSAIRNPRTY